jgi:hypothetical protein
VTRDWVATPGDLSTLVSWLDGSEDAGGESYVAMHGRLASYFARKGCRVPEDLADDTLTRVARRLREEGAITGVLPAQYCYIVARFVFLEHLRSPEHGGVGLVGDVPARPGGEPGGEEEGRDRLLATLDACLEQLDGRDRTLILEYSRAALRAHLQSGDRRILDELSAVTTELSTLALDGPGRTPAAQYRQRLTTLEQRRETLESDVSRRSAEFRAETRETTLADLRAALPAGAALVEFVAYEPFDSAAATDNAAHGPSRYAAYVIRRDAPTRGVDLGLAKAIDAAVPLPNAR